MRIVATAGIYLSGGDAVSLARLRQVVIDAGPDLLLLAGDLGQPPEDFEAALRLFADLHCPKGAIAGNRDLWSAEGGLTSEQLWRDFLPQTAVRHGYVWLESQNMSIGSLGVCGTLGWYDYSARDARLGYTLEQYAELKGLVNEDAQHIDWGWSDPDFAAQLQENFAARLELLDRDRSIERIVVVTHMPVFSEAILQNREDAQWNFGVAYAFNLTLGRAIATKPKVRHVVSGHTHRAGEWEISFGRNKFSAHVIGRNGENPRCLAIDI